MADNAQTRRPGRLKSRPEFLAVQKGNRARGPYFLLETLDRGLPGEAPRLGFTVTRKQGNAVERNRMRRRLKAAVRQMAGVPFKPGHDYVIVARRDTLSAPFGKLVDALEKRVAGNPERTMSGRTRQENSAGARNNTITPGASSPAIRNE